MLLKIMPLEPFDRGSPTKEQLAPLVGTLAPAFRSLVAAYLRSAAMVVAFMGWELDVLDVSGSGAGGVAIHTDLRYYWPGYAAHYVEKYGIGVDPGAFAYMREMNWTPPEIPSGSELCRAAENHILEQMKKYKRG